MSDMETRSPSQVAKFAAGFARRTALALALASALVTGAPKADAQEGQSQQAHGLVAYLGIMPAALIKGHDPSHVESTMHGGAGSGPHQYHLLIALFEQATGARIEDAEVAAMVTGLGHVGGTRIALEPMAIGDTVTYGNFVTLPGADLYTITVTVRRGATSEAATFEFTYDHRGQ